MAVSLFVLQVLLLVSGTQTEDHSGCNVTDSPTLLPKEKDKLAMDWVRVGVPVSIIRLFVEDEGHCVRVQTTTGNDIVQHMCHFVKTLTVEYVKLLTSEGKPHDNTTTYVREAMGRADNNSNKVELDCSMWNDIKNKAKSTLEPRDGIMSEAVFTARSSITGVFASSKKQCGVMCKSWEDVCGVTALLLDFLPEKPGQIPCPTLTTPQHHVCSCPNVTTQIESNVTCVPPSQNLTDGLVNKTTPNTTGGTKPKGTDKDAPNGTDSNLKSDIPNPGVQPTEAKATSGPDDSSPITSSTFVFLTIGVVVVAFLGYVTYYNREYLGKKLHGLCNGRKEGRPKTKNYKHLKSVKDALP